MQRLTLKQAVEHLKSRGTPFTLRVLKVAAQAFKADPKNPYGLPCEMIDAPRPYYAVQIEQLEAWADNEKIHRRGRRPSPKR